MKDRDPSVQTPKKCIKAYCLNVCTNEKKGRGRIGSKRDVLECINYECPLRNFRTGIARNRRSVISDKTKEERIARLERARERVSIAERKLAEAEESLSRLSERKETKRTELQKKYEDELERIQEKIEEKQRSVEIAKENLQDRKEAVRKMEIRFNEELEAGIWQ